MEWLINIAAAAFVAISMVSFLPTLFGTVPIPQIIFGMIIILSFTRWQSAVIWAIVGGLILDAALPHKGFYTLLLLAIIGLIRWLSNLLKWRAEGWIMPMVGLIMATISTLFEILISSQPISFQYLKIESSYLSGLIAAYLIWYVWNNFQLRRGRRAKLQFK